MSKIKFYITDTKVNVKDHEAVILVVQQSGSRPPQLNCWGWNPGSTTN